MLIMSVAFDDIELISKKWFNAENVQNETQHDNFRLTLKYSSLNLKYNDFQKVWLGTHSSAHVLQVYTHSSKLPFLKFLAHVREYQHVHVGLVLLQCILFEEKSQLLAYWH